VNDDFEEITIKTIVEAAGTGEVGDGKIFVSDVKEAYRIRTGEKGGQTLN
jgi:nitrogen regulatory protein P-II 1